MTFDLFKLHSKEDKPCGWIWVRLDSELIKNVYLNILKTKTQDKISEEISNKLKCGFSTILNHLIRLKRTNNKVWLPLPIVIELIKYSSLKSKAINSIDYLKNYNTSPIKAVKKPDMLLAKVIGSHLADGYLQKSMETYKLKLVDERKDSILNFQSWMKKLFNARCFIYFNEKENCWYCWIRNKIIGRYFEMIFEVLPGRKFDIAKEPKVIKNSSSKIRKAFALGVFTFDGGVKTTGMVALTTKSKHLADDLLKILKLDNLKMNLIYNKLRNIWALESDSGRNPKTIKKWLRYFEYGTWKYKRLDFFLHPDKYSKQEVFELFPENRLCKISLKDVYSAIEKLKTAKPKEIIKELKHEKRVETLGNTTIYKHLFILNKAGLVSKHQKYLSGHDYGIRQVSYSLVK